MSGVKGLRISVAMCTYNGARFLREQLESIAAQTLTPDELVVCDDRSRDESVAVVRSFAALAKFPVRLHINEENLGSTKNFEKAIGLCEGEVIALADQDDIWLPQKLNCLAKVLERDNRIGAVFSDAEFIDEGSGAIPGTLWASFRFNSMEQTKFERGEGLKVLLKHGTVTGATMAFRSSFRDLVLPVPSGHIHDGWIALLIACVSQLAPIGKPLVSYRKHPAQLVGPGEADSFLEAIGTARRAGRSHYSEEVNRLTEVCERLDGRSAEFPAHAFALPLIQQKIEHRKTRAGLPASKILRLPSLVREIATCRYWRYSNGLGSVAKDMLG